METFEYQRQRSGVLCHPVLDAVLGGVAHPDQHPLSAVTPAQRWGRIESEIVKETQAVIGPICLQVFDLCLKLGRIERYRPALEVPSGQGELFQRGNEALAKLDPDSVSEPRHSDMRAVLMMGKRHA
ncbi:MAG: hypothetical protein ACRESS_09820 [Stenotrophobium sp.]